MAIVCGIDFSEFSGPALRSAAALAQRLKEPLWLVHVLAPPSSSLDDAASSLMAKTEARLRAESGGLRRSTRVRPKARVLVGSPHQALLSFDEVRQPSLVIVSSQGHGASPLYRVGGTSERLAASSSVPVLVVRRAEPFEAWASRKRPLRIVLGVDFTASSESAVRWTMALRRAGPCELVVAHVYYADDAQRRYGRHGALSLVAPDPEIEKMIERDLAAFVGKLAGSGQVRFRAMLGLGRLADHLLDLAESERADLVVVGTHHARGAARLSSVSSGVLHMGRMAVAIVPTPEAALAGPEVLPSMRRVLVATDFSPFANHAVPYGYGLVAGAGGEVHLLHVIESRARTEPGSDAETETAARLRALVPRAAVGGRVATHTEVATGPVARTICQVAERLGVDAVCIASHGRSGLLRSVLGSVAGQVLKESRRPVLIVRPPLA